jgi:hypothetical protein
MSKYLIIVSLFSILLTGCGGSDSDSGSDGSPNNSGNTGGGMTYVAGEFKSADTTGQYAPRDANAYGNGGLECSSTYNYNYFESENVLVYGDPGLPNTDFQHAATLVENNLNEAFDVMGITRAGFDNYRPKYTPEVALNTIVGYLQAHYVDVDGVTVTRDITDIDSDFEAPGNWSAMVDDARFNYIKGYWNKISDAKQTELVTAYGELYGFDPVESNVVPEKIIVCLDQTKGDVLYGQGTLLGMNIAPNSKASRSDEEQVILHELIHTIQINVSIPVDAAITINDQWFMEGQAAKLSGQKVADSADGYYPVNVVHFADETNEFTDAGIAYLHYAKAYGYLDAHSHKENVLELLLDVRYYQSNGTNELYYGVSSDRFKDAFDDNIKQENGTQLTLENFRNNYHSLVK